MNATDITYFNTFNCSQLLAYTYLYCYKIYPMIFLFCYLYGRQKLKPYVCRIGYTNEKKTWIFSIFRLREQTYFFWSVKNDDCEFLLRLWQCGQTPPPLRVCARAAAPRFVTNKHDLARSRSDTPQARFIPASSRRPRTSLQRFKTKLRF